LKTKTADEWEVLLIEAGLPAARVRTLNEALESAQIASRSAIGQFPSVHSKEGVYKPAVAAFMSNEDGPAIHTAPPELGEHTEEVLADLGYSSAEIAELRQQGAL
ncbi:MAG: CoA transferase, partial [Pseudomonadota bacterium]